MNFWINPSLTSGNSTSTIGELGEQLVAFWLQSQNWIILHHRWRCRWGEIDLIARQDEEGKLTDTDKQPPTKSPLLAFVEVKTRSSRNWDADGRLAITPQKQAKLLQAAQLFLAEYPDLANLPCRFDVALVNCQRTSQPDSNSVSSLPLQLGQPIFKSGYRLILQDYIPSAFD